jgi:hypothetical protein
MEKTMNFTKSLTRTFLFLSLLTSTAVFCNENNEIDRLKRTSAEVGYKHPYVPGIALSLVVTKFFKEKPASKRFAAFAAIATAASLVCQSLCKEYLKNDLSCFEWMKLQEPPTFKSQFDLFKTHIKEKAIKLKNLFK